MNGLFLPVALGSIMAAKITGVSDLAKLMNQLSADVQQKVGRRMVVSAANVVKQQAKANVQAKGLIKTRTLVNNIVIKRETKVPKGTIQYNVGVRHGRNLTRKQKQAVKLVRRNGRVGKRYLNDPYYWRFLEFSTVRRAGTPFLGPALEQKQSAAIDKMSQVAKREIMKGQR